MLTIVLIGPPGCGKGTQGEKMVDTYHFDLIAVGNLLREHIYTNTPLKEQIAPYINQGHLIPDSLVISLVEMKIKTCKLTKHWLFDGFPRTLSQATFLDSMLHTLKRKVDGVIFLEITEEIVQQRIQHRALTSGRLDDQDKQKIVVRMQHYLCGTMPVISYYEKQNKLFKIDGSKSMKNVFQQVASIMEQLSI